VRLLTKHSVIDQDPRAMKAQCQHSLAWAFVREAEPRGGGQWWVDAATGHGLFGVAQPRS
jgi:hypothetical protein